MSYHLHIRVLEALDVPKMDFLSKSDPYCILRTSGSNQNQRTRVCKNTLTPKWNQEFHFPLRNPATEQLKILMKDEDVSFDDPISTLDLMISTIPMGQVVDQWFDMIPCRGVKKGGRIHLVLHCAPTGAPPFQPYMMQGMMGMQQGMMGMQQGMMGMGNAMMGMQPQMMPGMPMPQPQMMSGMPMSQPQMMPPPMMQPQMQPQPMYPPPMMQQGYPQPMMQQGYPQPMMQPGYPQPMMQPGYNPQFAPGYMAGMSEKEYKKMQKRQRKMMGY